MEIEFVYGPKTSIREHVNREVGAALIAGGFAVEISKLDANTELERVRNAHPPAGWSIVRGGPFAEKIWMRYDDGNGGYQLFEKVPPPQRVWCFDPTIDSEGHYEFQQLINVPPVVLDEFQRLGGGPANPFADDDKAIIARERREKAKYEAQKQGKLANTFLAKVGAKL